MIPPKQWIAKALSQTRQLKHQRRVQPLLTLEGKCVLVPDEPEASRVLTEMTKHWVHGIGLIFEEVLNYMGYHKMAPITKLLLTAPSPSSLPNHRPPLTPSSAYSAMSSYGSCWPNVPPTLSPSSLSYRKPHNNAQPDTTIEHLAR